MSYAQNMDNSPCIDTAIVNIEAGKLNAAENVLLDCVKKSHNEFDSENRFYALVLLQAIAAQNGDTSSVSAYENNIRQLFTGRHFYFSDINPDRFLEVISVVRGSIGIDREELADYLNRETRLIEEQVKNAEEKKADREISEQVTIRNLIILILFLVIILAFGIYSRYRYKSRINTELEEHRNKVEELNDELRRSNAELTELVAAKDKFFSIIAHDLKNPFYSIFGYAALLREEFNDITPDQRDYYIGQIESSAKRTYELLENLLHWASAQKGSLDILKEDIDLYETILENTALARSSAESKNITIENKTSPGLFIVADQFMATTALRNIISNAVKFTPENGRIIIDSKITEKNITLSITDTGVGIPEKKIDKLFNIDRNYSTRGTNNEKGSGLGLILSKEFMEKNDGSISVESGEGEGSTFFLTFVKSGYTSKTITFPHDSQQPTA